MSLKDTLRELRKTNAEQWAAIDALERKLAVKTRAALRAALASREWKIENDEPTLYFTETDMTDPIGRWRIRISGGVFKLQIATAAGWADLEDVLYFSDHLSIAQFRNDRTLILEGGIRASSGTGGEIKLYGKDSSSKPGSVEFLTPNAAKSADIPRLQISGNINLAVANWTTIEHNIIKTHILQLGFVTEVTISGGVATILRSFHYISTQSGAATDDLDTIEIGGGLGFADVCRMLVIRATYTDKTIVVKHGTGNIELIGGADVILDSTNKMLQLWWTGSNWTDVMGGGYMLGAAHPLVNTYISPTGTAGSDGSAQTVKTVVVPANTLTQVGDRLRIRSYWTGTTGGGITGTTTCNTVTVAAATDGGGADFFTTEAWLHYIDATHANIIETGAYPATGANSAANVAGFDWTSAQDVDVDQDNVANNHIIVYCIFLDVYPKGVV